MNEYTNQEKGLPRFFEIGYRPEHCIFDMRLSDEFAERVSAHLAKPGMIVANFLEKNPDFSRDFASTVFGIDSCLKRASGAEYFYEYAVPSLRVQTETKCMSCEGTGTDSIMHNKCTMCRGAGFEVENDEKATASVDSFCKTLFLLTNLQRHFYLEYADFDSKRIFNPGSLIDQQRMHIQISYETGMNKAWIGGWIHGELAKFAASLKREQEKRVTRTMASVEAKLFMRDPYESSFRFITNDGSFWLEVPGSASTLGTESDSGNHWPWGRLLSCHNIDHRTAQLCLLAGMATLDEMFLDSLPK